MNDYCIALYSRLSSDDGFQKNDESNSIANQKQLLENYVRHHEELSNYKTIHIWDDGYTGTNFNRPGAEKMLEMARQGKIHCIIVKDFSRFGRNYIEVGTYLEEVFPFLGLRFISVNDFFDSEYKKAAGSLEVGFKNLIHSHYPQETSRKVSEGKLLLTNMGKNVNSFTFFGYVKSEEDKHKVVIDEPAAKVVKYIFELRLQHLSLAEIARRLNTENIMTPAKRKRQLGSNLFVSTEASHWTQGNVSAILYDERYTGKLIYRKTKRKSAVSFDRMKVPKNEWVVIENLFTPIISQEIFDAVQDMKKKRSEQKYNSKSKLFNRIIKCGYCGKTLTMRSNEPHNYYCQTRRYMPDAACKDICIPEKSLAIVVLKMIQLQADLLLCDRERRKANDSSESEKLKSKMVELQTIISKRDADVFVYYEQYKNGSISRDDFISKKLQIGKSVEGARQELVILEEKLQKIAEMEYVFSSDRFKCFEKCKSIKALERDLIDALISRIDVYDGDRIEITWKHQKYIEGDVKKWEI